MGLDGHLCICIQNLGRSVGILVDFEDEVLDWLADGLAVQDAERAMVCGEGSDSRGPLVLLEATACELE